MPRITVSTTIPAGQSLSGVIDLAVGTANFLHMPPLWTPALLTFQLSPDGVTFSDFVDLKTTEIAFNVLPATSVRLPPEWISAASGYLKLRSGTAKRPIIQTADRLLVVSGWS